MEFHFNLFSVLEISICTVRHIIFLQDKCAVFHVPKLDQKKAINHVMAWERKQRSDFPLSRSVSLSLSLSFFSTSLCSWAPPISSPLLFLPHLISPVKPPPFPFLCFLSSTSPLRPSLILALDNDPEPYLPPCQYTWRGYSLIVVPGLQTITTTIAKRERAGLTRYHQLA